MVWEGRLLDGHHRLKICRKHGVKFKAVEVKLESRKEAEDWIDRNQLARRNLTPDQLRLVRGRLYNRTKKTMPEAGSMKGKSSDQNEQLKTAEVLSADWGVSPATIRRDGKFAEEIESNPVLLEAVQNREPVKPIMRELSREERDKSLGKVARTIPVDKYNLIYCDPPWRYEFSETESRALDNQYPSPKDPWK